MFLSYGVFLFLITPHCGQMQTLAQKPELDFLVCGVFTGMVIDDGKSVHCVKIALVDEAGVAE